MAEQDAGEMVTPIFGPTTITPAQAEAWMRANDAHQRFIDVIPLYFEIAPIYDIPAENGLGQAAHETGWGHFPGVVPHTHHNWCGLKTRNGTSNTDPEHHQKFPDNRTGIEAHIQHLLRYGHRELPNGRPLLDPRWHLVTKFTDTIEGLSGAWAPSPTYGQRVAARIRDLKETGDAMSLTDTIAQRIRDKGVEVHDIRSRMRRHATLRYRRLPNAAWIYTGVHHTAVSRGTRGLDGDIDSWVGHSVYHVNTQGWPGIAYAIGVSLSGRVFILRDIEEEGYHAFNANANTLAVCGDLTTGNAITEAFKRSLNAVLEVLHAAPEFPNLKDRSGTYGHRELAFVDTRNSGTACPGDLLPLVQQYRAGSSPPPPPDDRLKAVPEPNGDKNPWKPGNFWILQIFMNEIDKHPWHLTGWAVSNAFEHEGNVIQFFERARLELHPDNSVTRGLVGWEAMVAQFPERRL